MRRREDAPWLEHPPFGWPKKSRISGTSGQIFIQAYRIVVKFTNYKVEAGIGVNYNVSFEFWTRPIIILKNWFKAWFLKIKTYLIKSWDIWTTLTSLFRWTTRIFNKKYCTDQHHVSLIESAPYPTQCAKSTKYHSISMQTNDAHEWETNSMPT